jgi:DNA-binding MarR family transcriptional regulator
MPPAKTSSPDLLSAAELRAWRGFLRTHAMLVRELDAELEAAHGLPLTSYEVLLNLGSAADRRMRMHDLADAVLLSRSGLTRLVDRLVRDGLIERLSCPSDARGSFAKLTPKGAQALRTARVTHLRGVRARFIDQLDAAELERTSRLWERLLAADDGAGPTVAC